MTPVPEPRSPPAVRPPQPSQTYSEQLSAYEARRRAADNILLAKMLQPRERMNPAS